MTGNFHIIFAPMLETQIFWALAVAALLLTGYGLFRRVRGAVWRGAIFALILLTLANPSVISEQHEPIKDVVLLVVDDSASMKIADRSEQCAKAADDMSKKLAVFSDLEVQTLHVKGSDETDLFRAIDQKLTTIPQDRLAGVITMTDGQVHDKPETPLSAPFHALIVGHHNEVDRRVFVKEAPAYGLVGKSVTLTLRIEDEPKSQSENAAVTFRRDNGETIIMNMPIGKDMTFDVPVTHAGQNLFVFSTDALPHELTTLNNTAAVTINGIRDRLRVLLVSGEPHIGGRTWRNFLKADPAVDLIHFTILRSPMKMDNTPNTELSLIAFPVHELFETKLKSFDLVIFDRFRQQSLIPDEYLENIAKYVENGGALLISSATDEGIPPLALSPLQRILPTDPTGKLLTGTFVPDLSDAGKRHPVTGTLTADMPHNNWGPWFRQIDGRASKGEVLMTGLNNGPLLVLSHVGKGRVAQFLSDQFWLSSHGYKGGGPQAEMLRRVAHWLVQEPELDETALRAHGENTENGWQLVITKQSLHDNSAVITVTDPDNKTSQITLVAGHQVGVLTATVPVPATGLYHLKDDAADGEEILTMVGPTNALEFGDMRASENVLAPIIKASGGGINWLEDHAGGPDIHRTNVTGAQNGWNWIGLRQNGQYRVTGSKAWPLLPVWAMIAVLLAVAAAMWWREGKG